MSDQWPPPSAGQPNRGQWAPPGTASPRTAAAETTGPPPQRSGRSRWLVAFGLVVAAIAGAGIAVAAMTLLASPAAADVELRDLGNAGDDPFTDPVAPDPSATLSDFAEMEPVAVETSDLDPVGIGGGYRRAPGDVPGVFGGTLDEQGCDPDQLVAFLTAAPEKAAAWASVLSIAPADIAAYVDGLTGVNLGLDTRVLDHGFTNGEITARQVLLRRGTAVLIDARGVPRVNCYSGNPLLDPTIVEGEDYAGSAWPNLDSAVIVVVIGTTTDRQDFELVDVGSGDLFKRPVGTTGEADGSVQELTEATTDVVAAGLIQLGTPVAGRITDEPEIRYQADVPSSSILTIAVENQRDSVRGIGVELVSAGEQITFFRVQPDGSETFTYTLDDDAGGPYEIVVTEGPGDFTLTATAESQDDAGQGADAGDELATAFEVASGQRVEGWLADLDTGDRYLVPVDGGEVLTLVSETSNDATRAAAFTVEIAGEQLEFVRAQPGGTETWELVLGPGDTGQIEIVVTEGPGPYAFTLDVVDQTDGGEPGDASNELPEARTVTDLTTIDGEVGDRDPGDLYLFDAPDDELSVEVTVDASSAARVGVTVVGPDGTQIDFFRVEPGVTTTEVLTVEAGETHRLQVTEGRAAYTISLS